MDFDRKAFEETRRNAVQRLLDERNEDGHWTGELSSSALSTATAITALALVDRANNTTDHDELIDGGIVWLCDNQNEDGGWGDTDKSFSNISTTTLVWAAFAATGMADADHCREVMDRCEQHIRQYIGATNNIDPKQLASAIADRYGKDRTFSVPILTMCALSERLGEGRDAWGLIKQLPFELAAFPQRLFKSLNLQVVSYALPALIAIGQARHHHRPTSNPITRLLRAMTKLKTLRLLQRIQPSSGGFLEATPLTSFVTMSMAGSELADHPVVEKAVEFLVASARDDGSWPIDTNLATWVTTLSVKALAAGGKLNEHLDDDERKTICDWLLNQQYTEIHPYTNAEPGGWAWTDLPGGVPDADDTPGALLAISHLADSQDGRVTDQRAIDAATRGIKWLLRLTNSDGGTPTFCRGWGKLPFDRSSCDLTAHTLRAVERWWWSVEGDMKFSMDMITAGPEKFLLRNQRDDGSWEPLWFGNQHTDEEVNLTYGTSKVLLAMATVPFGESKDKATAGAIAWLTTNQNADGGWGGRRDTPSSIEETALALEALAALNEKSDHVRAAIGHGVNWLIEHTRRGIHFETAPIGFYFAKLWYYEQLYPIAFAVGALERVSVNLDD